MLTPVPALHSLFGNSKIQTCRRANNLREKGASAMSIDGGHGTTNDSLMGNSSLTAEELRRKGYLLPEKEKKTTGASMLRATKDPEPGEITRLLSKPD